jgi:DNA-binding protein HU-beta
MYLFSYICPVKSIQNYFVNFFNQQIIMNKTDLVNAIAEEAKLTKVQAKAALEAALCAVGGALAKGDKVALIGFGTFAVVEKGERPGVNPATKEKITIPARKVIKFKAGAELAAKVK